MRAPFISCQCLAYGRTEYVEEALEFFLPPAVAGPKELVIVNDLPEQRLHFDHPEVRIVNIGTRYATIGEKRNAAFRHSIGESHRLLGP